MREPIRRPGLIQSHGVMVTADPKTWVILQASQNADELVGCAARDLVGSPLAELLGQSVVDRLSAVLAGHLGAANPVAVVCNGISFDAMVHATDRAAVVELEPVQALDDFGSLPEVFAAMGRLAASLTREQLWATAARELHRLTRFDRVMIYHFHDDGHGQVVAEERTDDAIEPYLGLHYPASDIPAQARDLYLTKVSRTIASTFQDPVQLIPNENPATGEPLDLSGAELRSVSPHHSRFMRNMGQASTVSFSLIVDGELVGMITCAHFTERRLPYALRQALEVFAGQVALILGKLAEIKRLSSVSEFFALRKKLVVQFSSSGDPVKALLHGPATLFDLVRATGVAILHAGSLSVAGDVADRRTVERFVERLLQDGRELPFASDSLPTDYPELAAMLPDFAGVLIVPYGPDGDYLAWFRPELVETVRWLGDQSESNRDETLSPRNSFSAWTQSVEGKAEPWGAAQFAAIELGLDLDSAFVHMVEASLAQYALHDALTGLPNRRLFMDRLEHALAGHARGGHVAVFFIDIDDFKTFNDTLGHEGGDAVLTQVSERLVASTRASDTVARLGGDEFVVLCEEAKDKACYELSQRVLLALRNPIRFEGRDVPISASVGVATARIGDKTADIINRADRAMYRAKDGGKDQVAQ